MRVAAIIPVFNGRRFLRGAVESVLAQTALPAELLIIDDGSTDDPFTALDGLAISLPMRKLRQDNRGQSAARNYGARETACELLAFLDQDDHWLPQHLERLTAPFTEEPALGWTYSNVDEIDERGRLVQLGVLDSLRFRHPLTRLEEMLAANMHILPSASVVRRESYWAVGGYDERLSGYEDDDLFFRLFRAGFRYAYMQKALTEWRVWGNSSAHSRRMYESERIYAEKLIADLASPDGDHTHYVRNIVAPRFFANAMARYQGAMGLGDWASCAAALDDMRRYYSFTRGNRRINLQLKVMARPREYAAIKNVIARLPTRLRSLMK